MDNMKGYCMDKKENKLLEEDTNIKKVYGSPQLVEIGSVHKKTLGQKSVQFDDGAGFGAGTS